MPDSIPEFDSQESPESDDIVSAHREPQTITIGAKRFEFLGVQRGGARVYRGTHEYLRIGKQESIIRDLSLHRAMERAHYPVAPIVHEGEIDEGTFFIEKSLGPKSFRALFEQDIEATREILPEHFSAFLSIAKKLYTAQARNSEPAWNPEEFAEGIKLPVLCRELPNHAEQIRARYVAAVPRLKKLKGTLLHGDCNPANMYEGGIIDLEDSFHGPLGYDQVAALVSIEWSPIARYYEFYAHYHFNEDFKKEYRSALRKTSTRLQLTDPITHEKDLAFCRAVWLCTGMHEWPRIQQWRFEKFIQEYLHE